MLRRRGGGGGVGSAVVSGAARAGGGGGWGCVWRGGGGSGVGGGAVRGLGVAAWTSWAAARSATDAARPPAASRVARRTGQLMAAHDLRQAGGIGGGPRPPRPRP